MAFNFDQIIDRKTTNSVKWDARRSVFGQDDVIPLWVADMDFAAPEAVIKALVERASHPVYGYTFCPETVFQSLVSWFDQHHGWFIKRSAIVMCPGVVPSLSAVIMALTQPGDKVIVQPPVYPPFFSAVTNNGRTLLLNPLRLGPDGYSIDYAHLEWCAKQAELFVLCSPHNPVGRVWRQDELQQILEIAHCHNLTILSDEIHADLVFPDCQHIPLATLAEDVNIITAVSPSKSFNIPGLGMSALIVNDSKQRKAIETVFSNWHISMGNPFSIAAFEIAYTQGYDWLKALLTYLNQTRNQVCDFFKNTLPDIQVIPSQGTYLLWLDCRKIGLSDEALKQFFFRTAKVGLNPGISFGQAGSGFMRMNIASPRPLIRQALNNIKIAVESKR